MPTYTQICADSRSRGTSGRRRYPYLRHVRRYVFAVVRTCVIRGLTAIVLHHFRTVGLDIEDRTAAGRCSCARPYTLPCPGAQRDCLLDEVRQGIDTDPHQLAAHQSDRFVRRRRSCRCKRYGLMDRHGPAGTGHSCEIGDAIDGHCALPQFLPSQSMRRAALCWVGISALSCQIGDAGAVDNWAGLFSYIHRFCFRAELSAVCNRLTSVSLSFW